MSKTGTAIIEGLQDAVSYMEGTADKKRFVSHEFRPVSAPASVDVKAIRKTLGLSQSMFAAAFGLSLYTLRNWEQGKRQPDPAARAYLKVIAMSPDMVRKALLS